MLRNPQSLRPHIQDCSTPGLSSVDLAAFQEYLPSVDSTLGLVPELYMEALTSLNPEAPFPEHAALRSNEACLLVPVFLICYPNVGHMTPSSYSHSEAWATGTNKINVGKCTFSHSLSPVTLLTFFQQILVALNIHFALFIFPLLVYILLHKGLE